MHDRKTLFHEILHWITGITFLVLLILTAAAYNVYTVSERGKALPMLDRLVMRQPAAVSSLRTSETYQRQLELIYTAGPDRFFSGAGSEAARRHLSHIRNALYFFTADFHETAGAVTIVIACLLALVFVFLVLLGHRYGRIAAPGAVMAATGILSLVTVYGFDGCLACLFGLLFDSGSSSSFLSPAVLAEVFHPVLGSIAGPYITLTIAGSVLMAVALAGRIVSGPYRKKK